MRKPRVSLRSLILIVTAIGLYLGARQWRKETVLNLAEELTGEYYIFALPNDFIDKLWQRKPTVAIVFLENGRKKMKRLVTDFSGTEFWREFDDRPIIDKLEQRGVVEYE